MSAHAETGRWLLSEHRGGSNRTTFVRSMLMVPIERGQPIAAIGAYWSQVGAAKRE